MLPKPAETHIDAQAASAVQELGSFRFRSVVGPEADLEEMQDILSI